MTKLTYLTSWDWVQLFLWNYFFPSLHIQWTLVTSPIIINKKLFIMTFPCKRNKHDWKNKIVQRVNYEVFPPRASLPGDDHSMDGWTCFLTNHLCSLHSDHIITELLLFDNLVGENMYFTIFFSQRCKRLIFILRVANTFPPNLVVFGFNYSFCLFFCG